ncbi:alanine:cation symporter family protein, partial [Micrococcus luteus]|nr:alanine:cation symporter family protein [Micrococcus luteus]
GRAITVFRVLVLVCVVGGALGSVALVWNLADTFAALMATINLVAIIPLGGLAVKLLRDYERKLKAGMDPGFHISDLPEARNVALWRDEPKTSPLQD